MYLPGLFLISSWYDPLLWLFLELTCYLCLFLLPTGCWWPPWPSRFGRAERYCWSTWSAWWERISWSAWSFCKWFGEFKSEKCWDVTGTAHSRAPTFQCSTKYLLNFYPLKALLTSAGGSVKFFILGLKALGERQILQYCSVYHKLRWQGMKNETLWQAWSHFSIQNGKRFPGSNGQFQCGKTAVVQSLHWGAHAELCFYMNVNAYWKMYKSEKIR